MIRIQRQRTKGWRMPEGAIYVGRPTQSGNPFTAAGAAAQLSGVMVPTTDVMARFVVLNAYRAWLTAEVDEHLTIDLEPLRHATALACWCPIEQACHADVLIELGRERGLWS